MAAGSPEVHPDDTVAPANGEAPLVTVIIPVWNVEPWLRQCVDSVLGQSIAHDRLELVAVDDGSTDGSGALLDEYARRDPRVRVIHQPNSGGPGRPRNVGLDHARGRYVFFLDADDWLGEEALERLVAMAERYGSDVVLAKMVGVDGRRVPTNAFHRDVGRARLEAVYSTLNVLKLFRRSMVERVGLRFDEDVASAEDAPFTMRAYLEAGTISVLGSYDAYYCRTRAGSQSQTDHGGSLVAHLGRIRGRIELLESYVGPGPRRDRLMLRHVADVVRPFRRRWSELPDAERRAVFDAAVPLAEHTITPWIRVSSPQWIRLRAWCLQHGRYRELVDIAGAHGPAVLRALVSEGRKVYAPFPHFRDGSGIPDGCFEITRELVPVHGIANATVEDGILRVRGVAHLANVPGRVRLTLRPVLPGGVIEVPTTPVASPRVRDRYQAHPEAGYEAVLDLAGGADADALRRGLYRVCLTLGSDIVSRTVEARAHPSVRAADRRRRSRGGPGAVWRGDAAPALHADARGHLVLAVPPISRLDELGVRGRSVVTRLRRLPRAVARRLAFGVR